MQKLLFYTLIGFYKKTHMITLQVAFHETVLTKTESKTVKNIL